MKKINIFILVVLLAALCVFGQKIVQLPDITRPNWFVYPIYVEGDRLIIADGLRVMIYSLKDFSLLNSFGKKGEGPNEFLGYHEGTCVMISMSPDSLVVDSVGRISFYTKDGQFKKAIKTKSGKFFRSLGDDEYIIGYSSGVIDKELSGFITLFSQDFEVIKTLGKYKEPFVQPRVNPYAYRRPFPTLYDNKLFLDCIDGAFDVFDKKGNLLYHFKYDFEKVPVTDAHKNETLELLKADPRMKDQFNQFKSRIDFPDNFPIMKHYNISDGKIYVLTYKVVDNKNEFVVLDTKGNLIKKILFPLEQVSFIEPYPYTIDQGKLYQLVDNDKTEVWELHISDIK